MIIRIILIFLADISGARNNGSEMVKPATVNTRFAVA